MYRPLSKIAYTTVKKFHTIKSLVSDENIHPKLECLISYLETFIILLYVYDARHYTNELIRNKRQRTQFIASPVDKPPTLKTTVFDI